MTADGATGRARSTLSSVLPALMSALGEPTPGDAPPGMPSFPPVRAAALLLVDGLGSHLLSTHAADAPFLAGMADAGPIRVGFPSSTTISLASLGTGMSAGRHGMVGICFRVGPRDLLNTLGWISHDTGRARDLREQYPPERLQPAPTEFERAAAAGIDVRVVSPRAYAHSGLTRAALRGGRYRGTEALGDLAAEMIDAVSGPGRVLCFGYHSDLDTVGHARGPGSTAWRLQLAQVDRLVALIAERLPRDTLLAVTGDHGMIHVRRCYDADTLPDLRVGVAMLGGDPRARFVYPEPGATGEVLAAWRGVLGANAWVVPREQAVDEGWFGPVTPPALERIGEVVVAMRGTAAVVRSVVEPALATMPGQHGSLSKAEQLVPLLVTHAGA